MRRFRQGLIAARFVFWRIVVAASFVRGGFNATRARFGLEPVKDTVSSEPVDPSAPTTRRLSRSALEVAQVFVKLSRLPVLRSSCLPDAIVLERLLRTARVNADVVIGVAHPTDPKAHAWVEVGEVPIKLEDASGAFTPIARFRYHSPPAPPVPPDASAPPSSPAPSSPPAS